MSGAAPVFYDQTSDGVSIGVTSFIITVLAVVIATFAFLLSRKRTTNRPEQQQQQQVAEASKQEPKQLPTVLTSWTACHHSVSVRT